MVSSIDDRLNQIIRELIGNGITLEQAVEAFEGKYIVAAMSASRGNVTQASKALGVHRNTLHNKLRTQTMLNGFAESIGPAKPLSIVCVRSLLMLNGFAESIRPARRR